MKILRAFGNSNPSGIVINDGWLALAACVYGGLTADKALFRICGLPAAGRKQDPEQGRKWAAAIMELRRQHPGGITQMEIAAQVGCSRGFVAYVLNIKNKIYVRGRKAAK